MKKDFSLYFLSALALFGMASCSEGETEEGLKTIDIDLADVKTHHIDESRLIPLETNDSSLIYDVSSLAQVDGKWFIRSREFTRIFDAGNGKFLGNLSHVGHGPGEYNYISQFWNDGDTIRIRDTDKPYVMDYLPDKGYIGNSQDFEEIGEKYRAKPVYIVKDPEGQGYYFRNQYTGGSTPTNPKYSFLSNNGEVTEIQGRELADGAFFPDMMITDLEKKRVLAWDQLCDTLFTVSKEGISPIYAFNFGEQAFPAEYQSMPDFYERYRKFADENDPKVYASFIKYYQPVDNKLYFSFITNKEDIYLARLDEKTGKVLTYRFVGDDKTKDYLQQAFFKIVGDRVLISFIDRNHREANPMIYSLPLTDL